MSRSILVGPKYMSFLDVVPLVRVYPVCVGAVADLFLANEDRAMAE